MNRATLPKAGVQWPEIQHQLMALRADDLDWSHGAFYYHWPEPGRGIHTSAMAAANLFFSDIWLGRFNQPSLNKIIADLEGFVLDVHEAPDSAVVSLTSGGTESILTAMKAARDKARSERAPLTRPTVVAPVSAHPAFNRAAAYFDFEVVRIPVGTDLRADVDAMARAITDDTIALVGSAPSWPYGVIDPIPEIAALAAERELWCHVDACVGGFLVPFYRELGDDLTPMNLAVPGVTSISADLHKFGFTPHGISSVAYCDQAHADHAIFDFDSWPCGRYATDTIQGTKAGQIAASAWTTMRTLGRDGYLDIARRLRRATDRLAEGFSRHGVHKLADPEAGLLVVTSDEVDIFAVSEGLTRRGFPHCAVLEPEALHFVMNPVETDEPIDALVEAMSGAVADARSGRLSRADKQAAYA